MSNYTNEQLSEKYKKLPQDVQDAITSIETADIIRQIGNGKKMMIDRIGELAEETGLVLLGFTHPSQFVSHLAERLGIEKSLAKEIAEEINAKIFFPIRENLKKIHGMRQEQTLGVKEFQTPSVETSPPPLPSALMPETVVLETTIPKMAALSSEQQAPVISTAPVAPEVKPQQQKTASPEIPVQPTTSIFETKTKKIDLPIPSKEKTEPMLPKVAENKKIDPYREPII